MENWQQIFKKSAFRLFDHTEITSFGGHAFSAEASFAIDDALALSVTDGAMPAMRLWVHDPTIVLGIPDSRLPHLEKGLAYAHDFKHNIIIRNSGGLAVVLDRDVLNISLILPGAKHMGIHECYEMMVAFVRFMLRDWTDKIEAYEIVGSYCPGDYDLSIHGRKFAGISQRRVKEGAAIQIYLDARGDSKARAAFVRDFYKLSLGDEDVKTPPPVVRPETMASLSELLERDVTVEMLSLRAIESLDALSKGIVHEAFTETEQAAFNARLTLMDKRNETIKRHKFDN